MVTRSGIWTAVAAAILVVAGWLLDYPELVVLGIVAAVALAAAAVWMLRTPDVTVSREIQPPRVAEGDGARAVVIVTNNARRRSPPMVAAETVGDASVAVSLPSLAGGARFEAAYPLPTERRGVFEVGPLVVGHSDPLRLLHVARGFPSRSTLLVHPRVHAVAPLPTGGSPDMDGPTSATSPQGGVAFHSLREYVRGDDLRLIHWRSTARTGKLMVRHNVVPNEPRMTLVLDTSPAPYAISQAGDYNYFEDAVRVVASLAVSGSSAGFPVEVHTTGGHSVSVESLHDATSLLDLLAGVRLDDDDPGLSALRGLVPDPGSHVGARRGDRPGTADFDRGHFNRPETIYDGKPGLCRRGVWPAWPGGGRGVRHERTHQ
jgi:uncharacterized protein (DUF58 family)